MSAAKCFLGLVLSCAVSMGASACGGDDGPTGAMHDHLDGGGHPDGHVDDDGDAGHADAPCSAAYPAFRAGLETKAADLTVRLLSVDPQPPRQKSDNTWVLEVVDAAGKPVPGAVITSADTYMDVHKHGGRWEPTIAKGAAPGQFELTRIDFKMPGPWRLRFGVKPSADAAEARASFQICVE